MGCLDRYGLGVLPIVELLLTAATFIATYAIAVARGHVSYDFPYISDTGAKPPESCIFTLGLSISAFIAQSIIFIRYKQVAEYNKQDVERVLRLNRWSFYLGCLSPLGMLLVASFQDINVLSVHVFGAGLAFGFGCVYAWLQTYMTYRMRTTLRLRVLDVRFLLSLLSTACLVAVVIFAGIASREVLNYKKEFDHFHWPETKSGFRSHIVSTACEWAVGLLFLIFFLTFCQDFQRISLDVRLRLRMPTDFSVIGTIHDSTSVRLADDQDDDNNIW